MITRSSAVAQQSGTLQANGVQLYYERHGSGPNLVLIEGLGVATWIWEKQVPAFSRHFSTLIYDNRGAGKSEKPAGPYTIDMMADDLAALLDTLGIEKTHVLGISMGGFIAQDFALRFPERVDKLVLVSTSAGGPEHVAMQPEVLGTMMLTGGDPRALARKKLALAYSQSFMQGPEVEHLIDLRLADPQPPAAFMAQAMAGAGFNMAETAGLIQAPTLILAADGDIIVPAVNSRRLHQKIAGSRLKIFPDYGHQFFVEISPQFNQEVIEFLQEAR